MNKKIFAVLMGLLVITKVPMQGYHADIRLPDAQVATMAATVAASTLLYTVYYVGWKAPYLLNQRINNTSEWVGSIDKFLEEAKLQNMRTNVNIIRSGNQQFIQTQHTQSGRVDLQDLIGTLQKIVNKYSEPSFFNWLTSWIPRFRLVTSPVKEKRKMLAENLLSNAQTNLQLNLKDLHELKNTFLQAA